MDLYHFPLCPFSRKVRLFLKEKDIPFCEIEENPWKKRRPEFIALNPTGQVPVLCSDRIIIADSIAACEYVEEIYQHPILIGSSAKARADARRLTYWIDSKFYYEVTRYIINERVIKYYSGNLSPDSRAMRAARGNIVYHIKYFEALIERNGWIATGEFSIADIALAAHISVLDHLNDFPWQVSDIVKTWYSVVKSRPCFRQLLTDKVVGFTPPSHYTNLDF